MKIHLPFNGITIPKLKWLFVISLVGTLILFQIMNIFNQPLKNEAAPLGILSFEFAGNISTAQEMIQSWGEVGKITAGISLGFDFLFLVSYALTIFFGCIFVTQSFSLQNKLLLNFGVILAYAQFVAAILDSIENYALINVLVGSQQNIFATIAYWCALPKFVIVLIGVSYIVLGLGFYFINRIVSLKK
jgi:hypothetical protein